MRPFTIAVLACFVLVAFAVSARLLGLAARTRKAPELLLGLSLLLPLGGYTVMVVSTATNGGVAPRAGVEVGAALVDAGFVAVVGFVWIVFRSKDRWGGAVALLLALACVGMPIVNHVVPWNGGLPSALWPRAISRTLIYGWASVEALHYARLMRRRVKFGLAEPLIADRFTLWGLAHVCAALMIILLTVGGAFHIRQNEFADLIAWCGVALGLPGMLALGLSFFPPAAYVKHVERRFALLVAGEGA